MARFSNRNERRRDRDDDCGDLSQGERSASGARDLIGGGDIRGVADSLADAGGERFSADPHLARGLGEHP